MRKFLFALVVFAVMSSAAFADTIISTDTFPDAVFREYVRQFDTNSDGILQDNEIEAVTSISIISSDVSSLEGISVFTELKSLLCQNNNITALNLEGMTQLKEVYCAGNPITASAELHNLMHEDFYSEGKVHFKGVSLGENIDTTKFMAFDAKGEPVTLVSYDHDKVEAVFSAEPAIVVFTYNTGLENVTLSAAMLSDKARAIAPCTNGIFEGVSSGDVISWKGVPYAKQPTGSLRWKAPQAPETSSEHFEAFTYAATPIQHYSSTNPKEIMPAQGEECLALNVWTKSRDMSVLKPVMVWVHGGAFNSGGTGNPDYNGDKFIEARDDVVLVSVGYRVGLMGFIDFVNSGIAGCENFPDSQNLGLLDVVQALRWIKENIAAFGGDPENMTVFGQSSGGAMVSLLVSMPESAGLFRRAIIQSGGVSMTSSIDDCKALTQKLAELTGADTMDKLMALSSADLHDAAEKLQALMNFPERDGRIVAADPYEAFARNSASFDLLTGSMQNEVNYYALAMGGMEQFSQFVQYAYYQIVSGISAVSSEDAANAGEFLGVYMADNDGATEIEAMAAFLNDLLFRGPLLTQANNHAGKNYVYYWEYPSWIEGLGACHALDIPYVFNDNANALAVMNYNQELAYHVQDMWVNFARSGDPSTVYVTWPEYDDTAMATMIINDPLAVRNANLAEEYALIYPLLKYGVSGRELISAISSGTGTESEDVVPEPESPDVVPYGTVGSSGGGCNVGFMLPVMTAVLMFAAKKRF